ncbi:MAG: hypothetical protein KC457_00660 [Myxococcales bacterium]|nr:hypothetical protein [Myxococcales bacterium]
MRTTLFSGILAMIVLASTGCPKSEVEDAGSEDDLAADTDTDTGTDTTDGSLPTDCEAACDAQVACGQISADEQAACVATCEGDIAAYEQIFGSDCAESRRVSLSCVIATSCDGEAGLAVCEDLSIATAYACTQTVVPELDAFCDCLTAGVPDEPSDPFTGKEVCVIDSAEMAISNAATDGQDCLDAYLPIWGCLAASCNDPACSVDPLPDSCLCTEAEDALAAACPNLGG